SVNALADERFPGLPALAPAELLDQAAEFGTVLGELWDSWEDDATIREVSTGRYVDNSKIHHIDHNGPYFTVKGPLITPRPPQGQPPVAVRLDGSDKSIILAAAVAVADIVFVPVTGPAAAPVGSADAADGIAAIAATVAQLAAAASSMGRSRSSLTILAGVTVTDEDAAAVITRLRGIAGLDGVELRAEPTKLRAVVAAVAVVVQDVAAEGGPAGSASLRDRLGLDRPLSRYATTN
ncbi:MAG: FMNH2-utilizing monooxygenase, partial [Glaciihabitans sp.]|nr:FMNH2-utilizing monooxygenase [Glaciihabitans sp.]